MSNTDPLSGAPDLPVRGGVSRTSPTGGTKESLSSGQAADRLVETSWSPVPGTAASVTYAFRQSGLVPDPESRGFSQFNAEQIAIAERALQSWADVANISFTRIGGAGYSDQATILFANYESGPAAAFAYLAGQRSIASRSGDVWINTQHAYNVVPTGSNYGGNVLVHEIGHAIGLTHPADYDISDSATYASHAGYYEDSGQYTVMSYFGARNTGAEIAGHASLPLLDDITAIQRLYGANMATRADDTVYTLESVFNGSPARAIWDAGGIDTFDFSGSSFLKVDLREGAFSSIDGKVANLAIAYGTVIENLIGGVHGDTLIGNQAANVLIGNGGSDRMFGEGGDDWLRGGAGNDYLDGGSGSDTLDGGDDNDHLVGSPGIGPAGSAWEADYYFGGAGQDTIQGGPGNDHIWGHSPGAAGLPDGDDRLEGGGGNDYIHGNGGNDRIDGGDGNDRIYGGAGDDRLIGGAGRDYLQGNRGRDIISGMADDDTIRGGADDDTIAGDGGDDMLFGDMGDDRLIGGAGHDRMTGGPGRDTFVFDAGDAAFSDNVADRILDFEDGIDRIVLPFQVTQVLYGSSGADGAAAFAAGLLAGDPGDREVAAIAVGGDTWLFYRDDAGSGAPDSLVVLERVTATNIGLADFAI